MPLGIILLLPLALALFLDAAPGVARACRLSQRGSLWLVFFLLLAGFAPSLLLHLGRGFYCNPFLLVLLISFAVFLFSVADASARARSVMTALTVGAFTFCFLAGVFWWLGELLLGSEVFLVVLLVLLALVFGGDLRTMLPGVTLGLLVADLALACLFGGGIFGEVAGVATLNLLLLILFPAGAAAYLLQKLHRYLRQPLNKPAKRLE